MMKIPSPESLPNSSSAMMMVCAKLYILVIHCIKIEVFFIHIFIIHYYRYVCSIITTDAEVAALTGSLDDLCISRRSRSPSPLLYRPSLRERYGLRPLTPTEKLDLDIRVEQALRRSRSRERLARLELEESRSRSRERRTRLELERARSRSRERMARLELELAEKRRERLAREELEEVGLMIHVVGEYHSIPKNWTKKDHT